MNEFSPATCEKLGYYVYALVDPKDGKIFYIGKGKGNRVFQHALYAEAFEDAKSEKLDKIREILNREDCNNKVSYFIIRHGLDEKSAFEMESVLIDLLTYPLINTESVMTNLQAGHDQRTKGIKTAEDIELEYAAKDIEVNPEDYLLLVNISGSSRYTPNLYEATRGDWIIGKVKQKKITHVLAHYNGIVRAVFRPQEWICIPEGEKGKQRTRFIGQEIPDSPYKGMSVRKYTFSSKNRPNQNPVQYIDGQKIDSLS